MGADKPFDAALRRTVPDMLFCILCMANHCAMTANSSLSTLPSILSWRMANVVVSSPFLLRMVPSIASVLIKLFFALEVMDVLGIRVLLRTPALVMVMPWRLVQDFLAKIW